MLLYFLNPLTLSSNLTRIYQYNISVWKYSGEITVMIEKYDKNNQNGKPIYFIYLILINHNEVNIAVYVVFF